jgi:hypothetical protein
VGNVGPALNTNEGNQTKMKETVPIPAHLAANRMWRGLPVPFIALTKSDGEPDFRVTDEANRLFVIEHRRCQLCGKPLGRWMFFVGGTKAAEANRYFEPAAHLECTVYAMQVCPFIIGKIEHADLSKIQAQYNQPIGRVTTADDKSNVVVRSVDNILAARNPYWIIKKATGYDLDQTQHGTVLLIPRTIYETPPLHAESMSAQDWHDVRGLLLNHHNERKTK